MLSILIPTYNYDITALVTAISKQLENVNFPYEIIVADDNSSDKDITTENKKIVQLPHCTLFLQDENKGRTFTRNFLAEKANHDWLLFMDADVLPKRESFITDFNIHHTKADVVFGGITYEEKAPDTSKILRWKYGKAREAKPVSERKKIPYLSIISQCFLIKKTVFLEANDFYENVYGVDVLFTQNLEKMKVNVLHIDNPIIHLGLETSGSFIEKSKKGIETLVQFTIDKKVTEDYRPIQKIYLRLKNNLVLGLFFFIIDTLSSTIKKNLTSSNPSLFLFDLYRLHYYAKLKRKSHA